MRYLFLCLLAFFCRPGRAQLLLKNANVADVAGKQWRKGQDVLIQEGRIAAIGRQLRAPAGFTTVDASGKYLIPGLVDAHVHFFQSGGLYTRPDVLDLRKDRSQEQELRWVHQNMEGLLRRYLKAGITTVIDVGSSQHFLQQRDTFRAKPWAPAVYMTGPLLTTWEPPVYAGMGEEEPFQLMQSPEQARRLVQQQLPFHPDFIKIWYILNGKNIDSAARASLPVVQAAIAEAHQNGLRVAVHATELIAATLAVEAGADYLVHGVEDQPVTAEFTRLLRQKGTVLSPTLVVADNYNKVFGMLYQPTAEDLAYAHPTPLNSLYNLAAASDTATVNLYKNYTLRNRNKAAAEDSLRRANLKKLSDGGVIIATGTDAGNVGTQHVSSYFDELLEMKRSGLTNWDLLQASTVNAAKAMGKAGEFGAIQKGLRADLVLLNGDPADDLLQLQQIALLVRNGQVVQRDSLVRYRPEEVADRQLLAYNAHHLEAFLAAYTDDVEIYNLSSGKLLAKGKEEMRKQYSFLNGVKTLYCKVLNRVVEGKVVVDHEEIWTDGNKKQQGLAIYEMRGDKIAKVWFPD